MTVKTSIKAPTKKQIEATARDDLREVYLLAFDQFAITPTDVTIYTTDRINSRYARELLGVLVHEGLLAVSDVNGEEDVWQVSNPGTHDEATLEEATAVIDEFLNKTMPNSAPTATPTNGSQPKATQPKNPTGKCLCTCGENVAKSNYRPGHDARHAGNVARDIVANFNTKGYDRREALAALPSDKLRIKAEDMAERLIAKIESRAAAKAKVETPPLVKAKVGRATYEGIVNGDQFQYVDGKGNEKFSTKFTLVD
jgi:hypothetical protein